MKEPQIPSIVSDSNLCRQQLRDCNSCNGGVLSCVDDCYGRLGFMVPTLLEVIYDDLESLFLPSWEVVSQTTSRVVLLTRWLSSVTLIPIQLVLHPPLLSGANLHDRPKHSKYVQALDLEFCGDEQFGPLEVILS